VRKRGACFMRPEDTEERIRRHRRRIEYEEQTLRRLGYNPEETTAKQADRVIDFAHEKDKPEDNGIFGNL
jgi:hypothetical protein